MKLYHGTSTAILDEVLDTGLVSRKRRPGSRSLWPHAPSNKEAIYLTDCYAPYFAVNAARKKYGPMIIEVDTELMDPLFLTADEDALEQTSRGRDKVRGDLEQRTKHYRERLFEYAGGDAWKQSITALGTCAYLTTIKPWCITRILTFTEKDKMDLLWSWDASVTLMNYRFVGETYRKKTARMFRDPVEVDKEPQGFVDQWQVPFPACGLITLHEGKVVSKERLKALPDERVMPVFDQVEDMK